MTISINMEELYTHPVCSNKRKNPLWIQRTANVKHKQHMYEPPSYTSSIHIGHKTHCENQYCQQEQKLIATVIYIREQMADNLKHQNVSAIYIDQKSSRDYKTATMKPSTWNCPLINDKPVAFKSYQWTACQKSEQWNHYIFSQSIFQPAENHNIPVETGSVN